MIWFPLGVFAILIILGLTFVPASKRGSGFIFSCVLSLLSSFLIGFLYSFIKKLYPLTDDTTRIMLHYMVHDHLFFYFPGTIVVLLCLLCLRRDLTRIAAQAAAFVLFCFYMFMAMLATYFYSSHGSWADSYLLFYLTGARVFQCLVFASLAHFIIVKPKILLFIPALVVIIAVPFLTAQISFLYYTCKVHAATLFMASLYGVALVSYITAAFIAWRLKV